MKPDILLVEAMMPELETKLEHLEPACGGAGGAAPAVAPGW